MLPHGRYKVSTIKCWRIVLFGTTTSARRAARNKCRFGQRTKLRSKERHSERSISERSIGRSASERRVGAKTEPWKNGMNTCFRANANCPQLQTELRNGQSFGTKRASKQTAAVRCSECGQSQQAVRGDTAVQSQQVQPVCKRPQHVDVHVSCTCQRKL